MKSIVHTLSVVALSFSLTALAQADEAKPTKAKEVTPKAKKAKVTAPKAKKAKVTAPKAKKAQPQLGITFPEDRTTRSEWTFGWHGYVRMPIRFVDAPLGDREPLLIDDNYRESGFNYLRINETEWVELALSAERKQTRFVAGILAESLSDWSEQPSAFSVPAIGFVEHDEALIKDALDIRLRVGMFWRRLGYIEPYDTYLIGRVHGAGAMAQLRAHFGDYTLVLEGGATCHKRVATNELGFTPIAWTVAGIEHKMAQLQFYYLTTWNKDLKKTQADEQAFKDEEMSVLGFDLKADVPYFGRLAYTFSFIDAKQVKYLGYGVEVLHSARGFFLQENYFGQGDSFGTGEIQAHGLDLTWSLHRTLKPMIGQSSASKIKGLDLRLFGMMAWVATPEADPSSGAAVEDPAGRNDRRYLKWGTELFYRALGLGWERPFIAVRYDRIIPHSDYDSISFNVVSPRLGITLQPGMDVFVQYSRYTYGDNVNGGSGIKVPNSFSEERVWSGKEPSAVVPDENVFKIQAQLSW